MQQPVVNKWLDLLDRAGWTAIQASAGAALGALALDVSWDQVGAIVGMATAIAVCKVIIGQNTGDDDTGALIGTPVIEPAPVDVDSTNIRGGPR